MDSDIVLQDGTVRVTGDCLNAEVASAIFATYEGPRRDMQYGVVVSSEQVSLYNGGACLMVDSTGNLNAEVPTVFLGHVENGTLKYGLSAGPECAELANTVGHVSLDQAGGIDLQGSEVTLASAQQITMEAPSAFLGHHEDGSMKYGVSAGPGGLGLEVAGAGHVRIDLKGVIDLSGAGPIYLAARSIMAGPAARQIDLLATIRDLQRRLAVLEKKVNK